MTPRIPLRKCKNCARYHGYCPLEDLSPCSFVPINPNKEAKDRFLAFVAIVAGLVIAAAILWACKHQEVEETPATEPVSAVALLRGLHKGELSEYDKLILAIAFTESRWNPDAVGKNGDLGFLQITPVYVREANRVSGANFKHEDAFSIDSSLAMFAAIQGHYNPSRDIEEAIHRHNKSPEYRRRVLESLEMVERYEAIRMKLIEGH